MRSIQKALATTPLQRPGVELLVGLAITTGLAALLVVWMAPAEALLAAAGTALFLFVPGAALVRGLLGPRGSPLELAALASAISLATVPLLLYYVALAGGPINLWTLSATAAALTVLGLGLALRRRHVVTPARPSTSADGQGDVIPKGRFARLASWGAFGAITLLIAGLLPSATAGAGFIVYSGLAMISLVVAYVCPAGTRERLSRRLAAILLLALMLAPVVSRLSMFRQSPAPLGYDTGIYRATQDAYAAALPGLPVFVERSVGFSQPPALFLLTDVLHLSGWSTDATLWGLLIGLQLLLALGVWLVARDIGGRAAGLWALFLFAVSATQLTAYWHVYYKQILAITLLLYLVWLWRRESWLAVPVGAMLGGSHNMTFLLAGLTLLTDFFWIAPADPAAPGTLRLLRSYLSRTKLYQFGAGLLILALGLSLYYVAPTAITAFLSPDLAETARRFGIGAQVKSGQLFLIGPDHFLRLALPIIPFAVATVALGLRNPCARLTILWAAWAFVIVLFELLFYRRFLIPLDIAIVILAAPSLAAVTRMLWLNLAGRAIVLGALAAGVISFSVVYKERAPLIEYSEVEAILDARSIVPPDAFLMATDSMYAPWVLGYGEHATIAPGLFEHNKWNLDKWKVFWRPQSPEDRYALLDQYDRPIYIYVGDQQTVPRLEGDPLFEQVGQNLWRYDPHH